jgi:hypothetical protein
MKYFNSLFSLSLCSTKLLVYVGDEDAVFGKVKLDLKGKQLEHKGVKLELIGQIELFYDRGNHFEFLSQEKELLPAGVLDKSQEFDFEFAHAPKPHESFAGVNVRLRYFLRVSVARQMASNLVKELDFHVHVYQAPPEVNNTIKMEVGIEDCFSEDCEILTNRGFLDLDAYKAALAADAGLRVAAFDRASDSLVYQRGELIEHPRSTRTMVEFADADSQLHVWGPDADNSSSAPASSAASRTAVGLLVTPGHRMLATHTKTTAPRTANFANAGSYRECEARELVQRSGKYDAVKMMATARNGVRADAAAAADWSFVGDDVVAPTAAARAALVQLYGRFLVAGALDAHSQSVLLFARDNDTALLLADAGLRESIDFFVDAALHAVRVTKAAWWRFFASLGHGDNNIEVVALVPESSPTAAAAAAAAAAANSCAQPAASYEAPLQRAAPTVKRGDGGSEKQFASWVWTRSAETLAQLLDGVLAASGPCVATQSTRFRDELVRVALLAGRTAHFVGDAASGWRVHVAGGADAALVEPVLFKRSGASGRIDEVREVKYSGRVWCVRVPTTFIVARRAQKSADDGCVRKASRALVVGNCLHIEFEYGKSKYHLKDVVIGKIYFLLVRIKIKHMEIALLKRESTGSGANVYNESETLTKFEIMDGAPVRGESIPVRLFLGGFDLTPSYRNVESKFSLKYYLNLVLVDDEDRSVGFSFFLSFSFDSHPFPPTLLDTRRYFKQQEITLWRKVPSGLQAPTTQGGPAAPLQAYAGPREEAAAEAAAAAEAEVRRANDDKKKKKKKKKDEAAAATTATATAAAPATTATEAAGDSAQQAKQE